MTSAFRRHSDSDFRYRNFVYPRSSGDEQGVDLNKASVPLPKHSVSLHKHSVSLHIPKFVIRGRALPISKRLFAHNGSFVVAEDESVLSDRLESLKRHISSMARRNVLLVGESISSVDTMENEAVFIDSVKSDVCDNDDDVPVCVAEVDVVSSRLGKSSLKVLTPEVTELPDVVNATSLIAALFQYFSGWCPPQIYESDPNSAEMVVPPPQLPAMLSYENAPSKYCRQTEGEKKASLPILSALESKPDVIASHEGEYLPEAPLSSTQSHHHRYCLNPKDGVHVDEESEGLFASHHLHLGAVIDIIRFVNGLENGRVLEHANVFLADSDFAEGSFDSKLSWVRGDLIGKGGEGTVFQAYNNVDKKKMAVKQLALIPVQRRSTGERGPRSTLRTEAVRCWLRMDHRFIPKLHGISVNGGFCYLFQDYVGHKSIYEVAKRLLPVKDKCSINFIRIVRNLIRIIAYVHAQDVVFRDIHAKNILVDPSTGDVWLVDFGLARDKHSIKRSGLVGVADYWSPALAQGLTRQNAGSDGHALGCVIFKLLNAGWFFYDDVSQCGLCHKCTHKICNAIVLNPPLKKLGTAAKFLLTCTGHDRVLKRVIALLWKWERPNTLEECIKLMER